MLSSWSLQATSKVKRPSPATCWSNPCATAMYFLPSDRKSAPCGVDLSGLTSRVDHIASNVVLANAALNSQGARLNVLTQDVREIRTRLDGMDAKLDTVLTAVRALAPRDPPSA